MPDYKINIDANFEFQQSELMKQSVNRGRSIISDTVDKGGTGDSGLDDVLSGVIQDHKLLSQVMKVIKQGEQDVDELAKSAILVKDIKNQWSQLLGMMPTADLNAAVSVQHEMFQQMSRNIDRQVSQGIADQFKAPPPSGSTTADPMAEKLNEIVRKVAGKFGINESVFPGLGEKISSATKMIGPKLGGGILGGVAASIASMAPGGDEGKFGQIGDGAVSIASAGGGLLAGLGSRGALAGGLAGGAVGIALKVAQITWNKMLGVLDDMRAYSREMADKLNVIAGPLDGYSSEATQFTTALEVQREMAMFGRARQLNRAIGINAPIAIEGELRGRALTTQMDRTQLLLKSVTDKLFNVFLGPLLDAVTQLLDWFNDVIEPLVEDFVEFLDDPLQGTPMGMFFGTMLPKVTLLLSVLQMIHDQFAGEEDEDLEDPWLKAFLDDFNAITAGVAG